MKIQKLAAIYNVWDGIENLKGSIDLIEEHVDVFIIVGQTISNIGEQYDPWPEIHQAASGISKQVSYFNYFPDFKKNPSQNELEKRNIGLRLAKALRCSHFFSLDADEYHPRFKEAKEAYEESDLVGSICPIQTFFKKENWAFSSLENFFVPFIHAIPDNLDEPALSYPYLIDPTRRVAGYNNLDQVLYLTNYPMKHLSWIRNDIGRKCRNSSTPIDYINSSLYENFNSKELLEHPDGFYLSYFDRRISVVNELFC